MFKIMRTIVPLFGKVINLILTSILMMYKQSDVKQPAHSHMCMNIFKNLKQNLLLF